MTQQRRPQPRAQKWQRRLAAAAWAQFVAVDVLGFGVPLATSARWLGMNHYDSLGPVTVALGNRIPTLFEIQLTPLEGVDE